MIKDQVLRLLKNKQKELNHYHVHSIYLFGSVARGEEGPQSDIDILVDFQGPATFDRYMELKFYLEELFQKEVDLITQEGLRAEIRGYVEEDMIRAA